MNTMWSGPRDADGRPHGHGEWRDGEESYCGDMVHGVRCGTGVLRGALPGTIYSGEFAAGRFHGSGTWENTLTGVKFAGKWHDGARKEGTLTYGTRGKKQKLLSYSGGFINNRREGQGTVIFANGSELNGTFRDGLCVSGTLKTKHFTYIGMLKSWRPHDESNGSILWHHTELFFNGAFAEGKPVLPSLGEVAPRRGKFVTNELTLWEKNIYKGDVKHQVPHGRGILQYPNFNFYKGAFRKGVRAGVGKMTYVDSGFFYEGGESML
eukprot:g4922.t1